MNPAQPASNCSNRAGRFAVMVTLLLCATLRAQTGSTSLITAISSPRQVVNLGQNLTLSVTAPTATSFQWKRNGLPITGATSATYTITGATTWRDNGWYQVVAANSTGSVPSAVIFVDVVVNKAHVVVWGAENMPEQNSKTSAVTSVVAIDTFERFDLLLIADGTVIGTGSNFYGETTIPSGLTNVVGIGAGYGHGIALKSDGTVVAWGLDELGQRSVPATLKDVASVSAGGGHTLALRSDGSVVAWGQNNSGQASIPNGLSQVISVAAGTAHSLALLADGTAFAWGSNSNGQATVPAGLRNVIKIAAGTEHSVALKSDGTVVTWGGTTVPPNGLSNVVDISAGHIGAVLALKSDGTVVAWGPNESGQSTVPPRMGNVVGIVSGGYRSIAIRDATGDTGPTISTQPQSKVAEIGASATFSVEVQSGTNPNTFQWRKNGLLIAGATSAAYAINTVTSDDAGRYDVLVFNHLGSATSNAATLTVTAPAPAAPAITTQPASQSVNVGSSVIFSAVASVVLH